MEKNWESYRGFFQIQFLRYLAFWFSMVPIAATLLKDLPNPLPITVGGKIIYMNLSLPFHWQILWVSSVLFVISMIVYHIRCPSFIKKYNSYSDYQSYSHDPRWLAWETKNMISTAKVDQIQILHKRLETKGFVDQVESDSLENNGPECEIQPKQTVLYYQSGGSVHQLALPVIKEGIDSLEAEKGIFYEVFERYSTSRKPARWTIIILLMLSGGLFAIVLAQHIYTGGKMVYQWMASLI